MARILLASVALASFVVVAEAVASVHIAVTRHLLQSAMNKKTEPRTWGEARALAFFAEAQMTDEERHALLHGSHFGMSGPDAGYYVGNTPAIPRLGIPALKMQDAGGGFRSTLAASMQTSTCWPSLLAMAATWDTKMVETFAAALGQEYKGKGANVILGPSINVHRTAANGRNFEYLSGEDPYLGAQLTKAYVQGVQGEGVMAVAKHFAFNEQETNRMLESSDVDLRTAWELYYPPFEAAVEAGVGAIMCAYNKVNGKYSCENDEILKRDLKGAMQFHGFVMSDWLATHTPGALSHGLDQEQPLGLALNDLVLSTVVDQDNQKEAVTRILTSMYKLRLDADPGCSPPCLAELSSDQRSEAHTALALQAASSSVVLLKNDGALPIDVASVRKVAVLGNAADAAASNIFPDYYSGGGSGHVPPSAVKTPLESLRKRLTAAGIEVSSYTVKDPKEVVEAAKNADLVLFVAGTTSEEGADRASLSLDGNADELISKAAAVAPTVVLLQAPGAVFTSWRDEVSAIAALFLGGSETGDAWAAIVSGDATPSGKLPITLPASTSDTIAPTGQLHVPYKEGLLTSYRSPAVHAAFPFGHGLSYTTFSYGTPRVVTEGCDGQACVGLTVTNSGSRAGQEVVQAYLHFPQGPAGTPQQVLRGFHKTRLLPPGSSEDITFAFTARDLSTYRIGEGWVLYGPAEVRLGSSSADIRQTLSLVSSADKFGYSANAESS